MRGTNKIRIKSLCQHCVYRSCTGCQMELINMYSMWKKYVHRSEKHTHTCRYICSIVDSVLICGWTLGHRVPNTKNKARRLTSFTVQNASLPMPYMNRLNKSFTNRICLSRLEFQWSQRNSKGTRLPSWKIGNSNETICWSTLLYRIDTIDFVLLYRFAHSWDFSMKVSCQWRPTLFTTIFYIGREREKWWQNCSFKNDTVQHKICEWFFVISFGQ